MCSNNYDLSVRESMIEVEFYGNGQTQTNEAGRLGLYIGVTQQYTSEDVPYAYGLYDATKYLFRLYESGDARQWWNIADYKYVNNGGVVTEEPRTTAEKQKEDGNAAKWRAKYIPERPLSRNNSSINFPIIRYADVLLMIAECANEVNNGPTQEAIEAINQVRRRANASTVELGDFDYNSFKNSVLRNVLESFVSRFHAVWNFAGMEQLFRNQINILKDQSLNEQNKMIGYELTSVKAVPAINFAPKHIYYPIPQVELNTNPICGQTENW